MVYLDLEEKFLIFKAIAFEIVALSAQEAVIQHGSISEVQIVDPDHRVVFDSPSA